MTGIINRVPVGLLDLLDMKARGQTPRELAGQVSGSIDLLPFYEIDQERCYASLTSGFGGAGFIAAATVPADQIWHVRQATAIAFNMSVGAIIGVSVGLFSFTRLGGNFYSGPLGTVNQVTGAAGVSAAAYLDRDCWLGPGDQIGCYLASRSAGTVDVQCRGLYIPYDR